MSDWIKLKESRPEHMERVHICYVDDWGEKQIIIGFHVEAKSLSEDDFNVIRHWADDEMIEEEESGGRFVRDSWWEVPLLDTNREHGWPIDEEFILGWMPLPPVMPDS